MNYEKKYKEALERAKKLQETCDSTAVVGWCEYIFPELKISEGERIRGAIIDHLKDNNLTEWADWLEKQGKTSPILSNSSNIGKVEQKPADKVEPKFKVGDWIVQKNLGLYKVVEVCESWYEVISYNDGIQYSIGFDKENDCHLWTIQDAKGGDVLITNSNIVFIFKYLDEGGTIVFHASCTKNSGVYFPKIREQLCDQDVHPATKEQCDLLFEKMKEAGYEWDAEKKELKRVSQRMISAEVKEAMYAKPAWSEEDKGEISDGYHTFNELYYYRMLYNAAFFNLLPKEWVHKSKKHHDGEECFGGGWFIVMAELPTGQISNHYELKDWDLFQIPEKEVADEWDGHTPQEAAERLYKYLQRKITFKIDL